MSTAEIIAYVASGIATGGASATGVWTWLRARERTKAQTVHVEGEVRLAAERTGQHAIVAQREYVEQLVEDNRRLREELAGERAASVVLVGEIANLRVLDAQKTAALEAARTKLADVEEDLRTYRRRLDESDGQVRALQDRITQLLAASAPADGA